MLAVFDMGGTKTRVSVSRDADAFMEPTVFPTERDFKKQCSVLADAVVRMAGGTRISSAAGGVAGPLDRSRSRFVNSPNLAEWTGIDLAEGLSRALDAPVYLENDTAMAGLGEAHRGSGRGARIVAYVTVSTGIGGARITDGRLDETACGFEPGHHVIDVDKSLFPDAASGTVEDMASGSALERRTGKKAYEISDESVWEEEARLMAAALNNVTVFWSPDRIVLGGSMITGDPAIPLARTGELLREMLTIFPEPPEIVQAELGDFGGLHGALVYSKQSATRS